jgi:hypothetical protein
MGVHATYIWLAAQPPGAAAALAADRRPLFGQGAAFAAAAVEVDGKIAHCRGSPASVFALRGRVLVVRTIGVNAEYPAGECFGPAVGGGITQTAASVGAANAGDEG